MTYALVSHADNRFEIIDVEGDLSDSARLDAFQKLVGGYIEVVLDPHGEWHLYCNEDGKSMGLPTNTVSTTFIDHLNRRAGRPPFSSHDWLVGSVVWLGAVNHGDSDSISLEHIHRFTVWALASWQAAPTDSPQTHTAVRDGSDVRLYDRTDETVPAKIIELAEQARKRENHGKIEVWPV